MGLRRKRGMILVASLLLLVAILILGLVYLTSKANDRRAAGNKALAAQARSLALAGLERTRTKLEKDLHYPPPGAHDQDLFGYSEEVLDLDGSLFGTYTVEIDSRFTNFPYYRMRIECIGRVGRSNSPRARWTVAAELDTNPGTPTASNFYTNPRYFQIVHVQDPAR